MSRVVTVVQRYLLVLLIVAPIIYGLRWDSDQIGYNLNENQTATHPTDYWGQWENHTYHPSPKNWRFPFYTITLDRYLDGDPTNNDVNGSVFEHHWLTTHFRFGGDTKGLQNELDYLQGLGIKGIYLAGTPFLNRPWQGDGFGPLSFTLLDRHHGDIEDWRALISEIHRRDMYVIIDNVMATMADLIGFKGYLNETAPFNFREYDYVWKTGSRYDDFQPGNERDPNCEYPRMWAADGFPIDQQIRNQMDGCKDSEFDLYGDIKGTGAYPSHINSLSKFASVQDRLREWRPDVLEKIKRMSCVQISMLDFDGFRMDKSVQTTIDALAEFSTFQRECAKSLGKDNFLVVGEIVTDPNLASIYVGRGKQPNHALGSPAEAVTTSNTTDADQFVRPVGLSALDGSAFHYDIYGAMTRWLGLDGPWGARGVDWVQQWNFILEHNDMVNPNTGEFDPRHMFGMTNQDVLRWPALANGTQRHYLGLFVTMLEMPGIPLLLWGEEQEFYILENLVDDYLYGRQPMASSSAWQLHGCYDLGQDVYLDPPFNSSEGCHDDAVSLDHRDPAHPMRNVLKRMFELRDTFPVLNDGYNLTDLSQRTYDVYYPGSDGIPSPYGIWSVYRGRSELVQDFSGIGQENQGIWLLYTNENQSVAYEFDCASPNTSAALISPFPTGSTVKNLFHPYEEFVLEKSELQYRIEESDDFNGCLSRLEMAPWGYKAFVPKAAWVKPRPTITKTVPGHDQRLLASVPGDQSESVAIEIRFSAEMDCDSVFENIEIDSTTQDGGQPRLDPGSVECTSRSFDAPRYAGEIPTEWVFSANLDMVQHGVHTITIRNASAVDGEAFTNAVDRFMFRLGELDNPMVFIKHANYSSSLLHRDVETEELYISPRAAGADKLRYSTTWGSSFSEWFEYTGENITLQTQPWSGTSEQEWIGEHVVVHYWSQKTGSSDHVQHGDLAADGQLPRRFPHVFVQGEFNEHGYDAGIANEMELQAGGEWYYDLVADFPTEIVFNVWGMNPDGKRDRSQALGDDNADGVLDWVPPEHLSHNVVNISDLPQQGSLGYRLAVNDGTYGYKLIPTGSSSIQTATATLITTIPIITAIMGILLYVRFFCKVKFNQLGVSEKAGIFGTSRAVNDEKADGRIMSMVNTSKHALGFGSASNVAGATVEPAATPQRAILIATLEYEIEDWGIKVKIGGLGTMALLLAKHFNHHQLIWVIPCLGGIHYPVDYEDRPMVVTVLGQKYDVAVTRHQVKNINFVLLDAPIFRKQTKENPYPARMDDLQSAIFYSAWNQCIALAIHRFQPDLFHINDYHCALAPYYLPRVIPCCLSLHNAEFQGSWSVNTAKDMDEVCRIFNLRKELAERYVQFGGVFNLLHAGAMYLKKYQRGFGAVGVSGKYGQRSKQRYPILWALPNVGALQNPDPDDLESKEVALPITPDDKFERRKHRMEAQEWAGLTIDPEAELFVFIGRWSKQKGIDIIADIFFSSIMKQCPKAQLICVGPIIDLYGKFAALKLTKLAQQYPSRVYIKPEFISLPSFVFSGAEFALIPSRDEPFGLVAVEFGRKGALGIGSRVGGLGQMPGWWYTVESLTAKHIVDQLKRAIRTALSTDQATRSAMRAQARVQRFPVEKWVDELEELHTKAIHISRGRQEQQQQQRRSSFGQHLRSLTPSVSGRSTPVRSGGVQTPVERSNSAAFSDNLSQRSPSRTSSPAPRSMPRTESFQSLSAQLHNVAHASEGPPPAIPERLRTELGISGIDHAPAVGPNDRGNHTLTSPDDDSEGNSSEASQRHTPYASPVSSPTITPRSSSWHLRILGRTASGTPTPSHSQTDFFADEHSTDAQRTRRDPFSFDAVVQSNNKSELEEIDRVFLDSQDEFYTRFSEKLDKPNVDPADKSLCIEEYLMRSEKAWFARFDRAKLGLDPHRTFRHSGPALWQSMKLRWQGQTPSSTSERHQENARENRLTPDSASDDEFLLGSHYQPPNGIKKLLQKKIGDWQLYCFLLAFGQIIATNSYQITILTGEYGQASHKLYAIASVYVVASLVWWLVYRRLQAVYAVTLPFAVYGLSFLVLGTGMYTSNIGARHWVFNVATGLYAAASASGSLFFALNFGTDAGTPARTWAFRACVIQGTQQVYVAFLWFWGATLYRDSKELGPHLSRTAVTAVTIPLAVLMWSIGIILFLGLPKYYRRAPGNVPAFYQSLLKRKSVLVFFGLVIFQGYWLSPTYNRNWSFLWSSKHMPPGITIGLILLFFIGIWAAMLLILARQSATHPWLIPIFAISLGAPRWCQTLWSTSGIALYVPILPNSPLVGAMLSRMVWLWLGVLDAVQGVGFGLILLQTLTRFHVAATLIIGQVIGSIVVILAKLTAPHRVGPSSVFPNFGLLGSDGLERPWFWVGLLCQLIICVAFLKVFRKEQLHKP